MPYSSGVRLNCGHLCLSKCHQISDHSKMQCEEILYIQCPKGAHRQQYRCHQGLPDSCFKCDREAKMAAKRQKEEFERQERQDREQHRHAEQMAELDREITREREKTRAAQLEAERAGALSQKQQDLREATEFAQRATTVAIPPADPSIANSSSPLGTTSIAEKMKIFFRGASAPNQPTPPEEPTKVQTETNELKITPTPVPAPKPRSLAKEDWERQKAIDGAMNEAMDAIMGMAGLEKVKETVLDIKTTVETSQRQGTSLTDRRLVPLRKEYRYLMHIA
jgi:hypothetical protein